MPRKPVRREHRPSSIAVGWLVRVVLLAGLGSIFFGAPAALVIPLTVAVFSGMNPALRRQIMGARK